MFTGIITDIGRIEAVDELDGGRSLTVSTAWDLSDLEIGASVAICGVCLTVTSIAANAFTVEAWSETLGLTTLGSLGIGDRLNLERSLRLGDELGGHLVSGHIDGIADVLDRQASGEAVMFTLDAPEELSPFIAKKGSVCLDGVSLTVNDVDANRFAVLIIRHTLRHTTVGDWRTGSRVNLEVDRLARYAARYASSDGRGVS